MKRKPIETFSMAILTSLRSGLKSYTKKSRKPSNYSLLPYYFGFYESFENQQHYFQLQFLKHHDLKSKFFK